MDVDIGIFATRNYATHMQNTYNISSRYYMEAAGKG